VKRRICGEKRQEGCKHHLPKEKIIITLLKVPKHLTGDLGLETLSALYVFLPCA
jgi:hypothetical protein